MTVPYQVGYCTNVHAGADLAQTRAQLERYAVAVKQRVSPGAPMGIGLWLSAASAARLRTDGALPEFADWLAEAGLVPFTLNGFPFGDFHQASVKHRVYLPAWDDPARLAYTRDLIAIQHACLPPGMEGSISTLPVAWGDPRPDADRLRRAAEQLATLATELARLEADTGRLIYLCLEPEPGCVLQRSGDVVAFWEDVLLFGRDEGAIRRYLRVCHDVCHAAVMFEPQAAVLDRYRAAGIAVGKVQVSAAVWLRPEEPSQRPEALAQLAGFAEDRYLHQTVIRPTPADEPVFFEDLPGALAAVPRFGPEAEWRVHFHVPIYLQRFGRLGASQDDIRTCLADPQRLDGVGHFEVETYAWGVLPPELRQPDLAAGIAQELTWCRELLQARTLRPRPPC